MKLALAMALAGVVACGGRNPAAQSQDDAGIAQGPGDAGIAAGDAGTAQGPVDGGASTHWVLEAPGIRGDFQSPAPGDIWVGSYHRVNGSWISAFTMIGDFIWVASPTEAWFVASRAAVLYVWTPSGLTGFDLSKPAREYTAVGDGWIAYTDWQPNSPCCNGLVGLMRPSNGSFVEVPLSSARGRVMDIYAGTALTEYGEVFSWNGSTWTRKGSVSHPAGVTSMYAWTKLSGSGSDELYATAWLYASRFDGSAWSDFSFPGRVPQWIWVRPYGPRWAIGGGAAGAELFEWDGSTWQDRGRPPGNWNFGGPPVVGSDGIDVFVADYDGIYRYVR